MPKQANSGNDQYVQVRRSKRLRARSHGNHSRETTGLDISRSLAESRTLSSRSKRWRRRCHESRMREMSTANGSKTLKKSSLLNRNSAVVQGIKTWNNSDELEAGLGKLDDFPDDVLENILSRLSLRDYLQMRRVCKVWDGFVRSHGWSEFFPCFQRPWFLEGWAAVDFRKLAVGDPFGNNSYLIRLPRTSSIIPICGRIVSAGGLICCLQDNAKRTLVTVFNPLTKAKRELPEYYRFSSLRDLHLLEMVVIDLSARHYKVFLRGVREGGTGGLPCQPSLITYDSSANSWSMNDFSEHCPRREVCKGEGCTGHGLIYKEGMVYIITTNPATKENLFFVFDTVTERWQEICTTFPDGTIGSRLKLLLFGGRIFIVGEERKPDVHGEPWKQTVCIWELEVSSSQWIEFTRMPELEASLKGVYSIDIHFQQIGDLVIGLDTMEGPRQRYRRDSRNFRTVIYDFSKNLWYRAPDFRSRAGTLVKVAGYCDDESCGGIVYGPRLDARP